MRKLPRHSRWIRKMLLPLLGMAVYSYVWAMTAEWAMYRILGVTPYCEQGRALSIPEMLMSRLPNSVILVLLAGFVLAGVMLLLRWHFQWWVLGASITFVGSPIAIVGGTLYVHYLLALPGTSGEFWYAMPVVVGFGMACVVGLVADALWNRMLLRMMSHRVALVICPSCGYDLRGTIAAGSTRCSECGTPFELVRLKIPPLIENTSSLDGVASRVPDDSASI